MASSRRLWPSTRPWPRTWAQPPRSVLRVRKHDSPPAPPSALRAPRGHGLRGSLQVFEGGLGNLDETGSAFAEVQRLRRGYVLLRCRSGRFSLTCWAADRLGPLAKPPPFRWRGLLSCGLFRLRYPRPLARRGDLPSLCTRVQRLRRSDVSGPERAGEGRPRILWPDVRVPAPRSGAVAPTQHFERAASREVVRPR